MACCGGKRRRLQAHRAAPRRRGGDHHSPSVVTRRPAPTTVYFKYRGPTRMTVIGSASGRHYRFGSPGAVLAVDGRDGPAIAAVPGLQRVKSPASVG